jgi:N-methylhydantoinase A
VIISADADYECTADSHGHADRSPGVGGLVDYVGVDIGGTFTDVVRLGDDGSIQIDKVPSSGDPSTLLDAIRAIGADPRDLGFLGVGTTVGTNALIERTGASTALIATRGFRDLLELRRNNREEIYDLQWDMPSPLIPRYNRLEITERVTWRGEVLVPLAEEEVQRLVRILRKRAIASVAIVFLHSYANDANEQRLRELLLAELPELHVSISSDILPMYREFERTATVATNAYLAPVIRHYFGELKALLEEAGYDREIQVMQSNGGLASLRSGAETPARLVRSGPSAGCVALEELAHSIGEPDLIGLDIGGTSADVSLVRDGRAKLSDRNVPEWGLPVVLPSLDIISIGAGGGSIARIDDGGSLRVGPESAGAVPGPACYRKGGTLPTSTDAQAVLGRLGANLVGGDFAIDAELAERAIDAHVARPLGLTAVAAAQGILRILTDNMMRAVRLVTIERGFDPREFVLCGFGGNGPMYAVDVARDLAIPRVVIPRFPGVFSAYGVLRADIVYDATRTLLVDLEPDAAPVVTATLDRLQGVALERFAGDGVDTADVTFRWVAELRYRAQVHELAVEVPSGDFDAASVTALATAFHEQHHATFGHSEPGDAVILVNLKVFGTKVRDPLPVRGATAVPAGPAQTRAVFFPDAGWVDTVVRDRRSLAAGDVIEGPALLTQTDTTCVLPPGSRAVCTETADLIVEVGTA